MVFNSFWHLFTKSEKKKKRVLVTSGRIDFMWIRLVVNKNWLVLV